MRRRAGNLTREPARLTPASPPLRTVAITINHKSRFIVYSSSLSFCLFRLVGTGKSLKYQLDECSDMFWWRHMHDGISCQQSIAKDIGQQRTDQQAADQFKIVSNNHTVLACAL